MENLPAPRKGCGQATSVSEDEHGAIVDVNDEETTRVPAAPDLVNVQDNRLSSVDVEGCFLPWAHRVKRPSMDSGLRRAFKSASAFLNSGMLAQTSPATIKASSLWTGSLLTHSRLAPISTWRSEIHQSLRALLL